MKTSYKIIFFGLSAAILFFSSSCSAQPGITDNEKGGYQKVYDSHEESWWFKASSAKISDECHDEQLLEAWVRIDYKEHKATEIALWYFRTRSGEYKNAHTYIYDYEGYALDT